MQDIKITKVIARDIRFPTSRNLDGSDATNKDPDYSAAYATLFTNHDGLQGDGITFTIGRGNEICVAAINALAPLLIGHTLNEFTQDMGAFWSYITGDSQLRWIGPEKGAIHLATGAVVNAVWDLWAKAVGKPVWELIVDMTPEELLRCMTFRYISDVITQKEALTMLQKLAPTKAARKAEMLKTGYPAYTTSAGWLGYSDEKLKRLCQEAVNDGWNHIKLKVGGNLEDDIRRCKIAREMIGPHRKLMVDANQRWKENISVDEAWHRVTLGQPIHEFCKPIEVANLVYFLCSGQTPFMTGSIISIDGGYTAQ